MRMHEYIKKCNNSELMLGVKQAVGVAAEFIFAHKRKAMIVLGAMFLMIAAATLIAKNVKEAEIASIGDLGISELSSAAASAQKSVISIPKGIVKANPFVPYRDITESSSVVRDIPAYNIVEPPEFVNENSDAARVMDTIVSGILYDKFSPSAIINIEGNDYLVKKGDVVNNYKILNITGDSVSVQLGKNVYKAGIGEILTEGTMNHNEVSNLKNKFGGERNGLQ